MQGVPGKKIASPHLGEEQVKRDDDKQPEQEQGTGEKVTQHFHLLTPETDLTDNSIRGRYLGLGFVRDTDLHGAHSDCEAAALGHQQKL